MRVERHVATAVASADHPEREQHGAGVIRMAVREDDAFDRAEIDTEPRHIALEGVILRSGVEQHRAAHVAAMHRHEA